MAKNDMVIQIENRLRPCVVTIPEIKNLEKYLNGRSKIVVVREKEKHNALFHCWRENFCSVSSTVYKEMPDLYGIVEYEDGTVHRINAEWIQFVDGMINKFYFPESEKKNGE